MTSNYVSLKKKEEMTQQKQKHESSVEELQKKREEDENVRKMGHILKRLNSPQSKPHMKRANFFSKDSKRSFAAESYQLEQEE